MKANSNSSLFYAALELRCGIEARMQEYLEAWDHISKKKRSGWNIGALGRTLEDAFRAGNDVVQWGVHDRNTGAAVIIFYHTPVTRRLRNRGEKLGNFLHSQKRFRSNDDTWWSSFRKELVATANELHIANRGTLLGPPLQKSAGGELRIRTAHMKLEIPPHVDATIVSKAISGISCVVKVKYLESLPADDHEKALLWP